jgi:methylglutaconyl-CoA hydratase
MEYLTQQQTASFHFNLFDSYATMRPRLSHHCLLSVKVQIRHSTTSAPFINIRNIPAPHSGSIRILSLNSPKNRNAISRSLLSSLSHEIASIHNESPRGPTRALIIASDVDEAFCAGADLKERRGFTKEELEHSTITFFPS